MTLTVTATEAKAGTDIAADLTAAGLTTKASASLSEKAIDLKGVSGAATLSPALVGRVMDVYAPDVKQRPSLAGPTPLAFEVQAMTVPLRGGKPDMAGSTPIKAKASLSAPLALRGLDLGGERSAEIGLRGMTLETTWSLAEGAKKQADVQAEVFDPRDSGKIAALRAGVDLTRPDAPNLSVNLAGVDTPRLDGALGMPGLTDLALGSPASLSATVAPEGGKDGRRAEVQIESPRLATKASLDVRGDRAVLTRAMDVAWTMDRRWAARYLTPSVGGEKPAVAFAADTPITLRVDRLAVSLGDGAGPLKPGVLDLAAKAEIKGADLVTRDNEPLRIGDAALGLQTADEGRTLGFDLSMRDVSGGAAQGGAAQTRATGRITRFADASGRPTPDTAEATLDADGRMPTALIDALGGGHGRILELLGATTEVKAQARSLSRTGGTLAASLGAPRAEAGLEGAVRDGVFRSSKPVTATLYEITSRLSAMTIDTAFPLLTTFEKRREDGPATLSVSGLELPLRPEIASKPGGPRDTIDLRKLNGVVRLEIGQARYRTGDLLTRMLNMQSLVPNVRTQGSLFSRFPPIEVRVVNGVAQYERTTFPIGEFQIETRGTVDLAARTLDLIVYVPLVGVVDEFAGVFRRVPGLNQSGNVPFRIKGTFENAVPVPAPDLILKDALGDVKKDPGKVIENVGNVIEDLLKKKKK